MKWSLRTRLLAMALVVVALIGAVTLFAIERTLAGDLLKSLDTRLVYQGKAVANWLESGDRDPSTGDSTGAGTGAGTGHGGGGAADDEQRVDRIAGRLSRVTGARITIVGSDGRIQGDSALRANVGTFAEDAPELVKARTGEIGRAERALVRGQPPYYLVAVKHDRTDRIVRLAWPLSDVIATRQRMRNRLLVGSVLGFIGALLLAAVVLRAVVRPLQSMTRAAERLARGDYDVTPPVEAVNAGGELAVLARSITHLATEVKARVADLTTQRDLMRGVVGTLVEGVIVLGADAEVILVNAAAQPLVGDGDLPPELVELVDAALAEARDHRYRPETSRSGSEAPLSHEAEIELRGRAVRASSLPLPSGGAIVVLYDVTRLLALELQSREFLASAAHELRTPVTAISGSAETLLAGPADAATAAEFLEVIHRNAQRIARLVSDLLVLEGLGARPEAIGVRASIALAAVVHDAARTARAVSPGVEIEIDVPAELTVMGTRDGLDHVVQNLVDNAVKHGGAGAPVIVRAGARGRRVRLEITDRGPGIAAAHHARVFERFYRVDAGRSRADGGSGLGLAIVKSQAEAINGTVHVESEPGAGATFVVELDLADDEALRREAHRRGRPRPTP